ncbi:MAG: 2-oxo acid dehydrogenase subunit E2, partial [Microbacterium sp.]|uniref:E3 binding domain-containing protein n=1 Tax=Microbacterium sp. TaxID=51671 RepID=UPI00282DA943
MGAPVLEVADPSSDRFLSERSETKDAGGDVEKDAYRAEERAGSGSGNVLIGYGTTERAGSGRRRARRTAGRSLGSSSEDAAPRRPRRDAAPEEPPAPPSPSPDRFLSERSETKDGPVAVRSPLVRRLARDLGVDVLRISPTGSDGAVTRADVLRAAVDQAVDGMSLHTLSSPSGIPAATPEAPGDTVDGLAVASRERMSPLRKAVSAKLTRSRSEIPEATVWVDVDVTELWALRAAMAPEGGRAPSLTALVARFVLIARAEHPLLAS